MDPQGSLANLISSLSTSGAQWYALVSAPPGTIAPPSIPNFAPTSQSSIIGQGITSGSNILVIGVLAIAAYFLIKIFKA